MQIADGTGRLALDAQMSLGMHSRCRRCLWGVTSGTIGRGGPALMPALTAATTPTASNPHEQAREDLLQVHLAPGRHPRRRCTCRVNRGSHGRLACLRRLGPPPPLLQQPRSQHQRAGQPLLSRWSRDTCTGLTHVCLPFTAKGSTGLTHKGQPANTQAHMTWGRPVYKSRVINQACAAADPADAPAGHHPRTSLTVCDTAAALVRGLISKECTAVQALCASVTPACLSCS